MKEDQKYGLLLHNNDIKLSRQYFREMCKLIGVYVLYRAPLEDKSYTTYAEIDSNFAPPILTGCLFEQHPNQYTTKKLGWVSELQENASLIHVEYDLPNLQIGSLFIVPSGLDDGKGRLFKVTKISNIMIYPSSITCEIVPEYEDTLEPETIYDHTDGSFNVLQDEEQSIFIGGDYYIG